ncbi:metal ABC transporter substrate-binding protein [Egicoccus sp. AB-alg2]|uniref:metal ABC transporter substrate-binding protein n=1 Tax=Egicoccus sp. AB-alg2 TaxID=3242693 RepID=UPI00359E2001
MRQRRLWPGVTIGAALALLVVACGGPGADAPDGAAPSPGTGADAPGGADGPDADGGEPNDQELDTAEQVRLQVVATVAPVADLVARVGGPGVEVDTLVPAGADSHTYEPRPQDVVGLSEADAFFGIGLDLNPASVALAETSLPDEAPLLLLGERIDGDGLIYDHVHGEDGHSHGADTGHSHGDDTGHTHDDDGHTHDDDGHTHDDDATDDEQQAGPNPHVWTSVRLAAELVEEIAWVFADLDPDHADEYQERAEELQVELADLDRRIQTAVGTIPADQRTLVAYHDAWSYFARDYGFDLVTAVQPSDYAEPSAGDVRAVIDLIREHDVPAVFGSEVFPSGVLDTIAAETGATYVGDLADDELPGEPGSDEHTYVELMRRNAVTIVEALGGEPTALTDG